MLQKLIDVSLTSTSTRWTIVKALHIALQFSVVHKATSWGCKRNKKKSQWGI